MSSQRFCLRWNNHQSNLLSVFDQLLHDEAFVDVTLAVEGQFLKAHKMVLSACSPYFQALFVGHPDKHPIVILKDVPYSDMKSLLDFMYRGEVSVDQDRLTAFLKVAESLRIKGLTEVNEERCDLPSIANSLLSQALPPPPPPPPPPSLHRLPPVKRHPPPPPSINPMLNSALTAPKRKRGRPRKLSGSSPGQPPSAHHQDSMDHEEKHQPHLPSPLMENHLGALPSSMQQQMQAHQQQLQAQQQHHMHQLQQHHHHLQVAALPPQLPGSQGENVTLRRCLSPGGGGGGSASPRDEEESSLKQEEEEEDDEGMMDGEMSENMKEEAEEDGAPEDEGRRGHQEEGQRSPGEASKNQPKPSTSGQESSYQNNTQTDGERFSTSDVNSCGESLYTEMDEDSEGSNMTGCYDDMIACSPASSELDETGAVNPELVDDDISQFEEDSFRSLMAQQPPHPTEMLEFGTTDGATIKRKIDKTSIRKYCTREGNHTYRCSFCSKTYTHISNFCRHFLSAHYGVKQAIQCPVCRKQFTRKDNMMTHAKQVHGQLPSTTRTHNTEPTPYQTNSD